MTAFTLDVHAYDGDHAGALLGGPDGERWRDLFANGLKVSDAELLVHAMFQQQHDRPDFRSFNDLASRAHEGEALFRRYFELSSGTLHALSKAADVPKYLTEGLGVAIAILAVNQVSGLTEADWKKIRETSKHKTLDYQWRASDGSRFVRVEAKGTVSNAKTSLYSSTVIKMMKHIAAKKRVARSGSSGTPSVEYGVITALSSEAYAPTVFALDPPAPDEPEDPRRERLLTRLEFYARHLALVRRFRMLTVLRNRMSAIAALSELSDLDGVPLVRETGERFTSPSTFPSPPMLEVDGVLGRLLSAPSKPAASNTRPPPSALFIGFEKELFDILARQRYDDVLDYRAARRAQERSVAVPSSDNAPVINGRLAFSVNAAGIAFGSVASS